MVTTFSSHRLNDKMIIKDNCDVCMSPAKIVCLIKKSHKEPQNSFIFQFYMTRILSLFKNGLCCFRDKFLYCNWNSRYSSKTVSQKCIMQLDRMFKCMKKLFPRSIIRLMFEQLFVSYHKIIYVFNNKYVMAVRFSICMCV